MQLISLVPTDPGILQRLGEMYDSDNDRSQAFQYHYEVRSLPPSSHFGAFTSPVKKTYTSSATYSMQLQTCSHTLPLPCSHSGTVPPTLMSSPGWVPTTWTLNLLTRQSTILRGLPLYSKMSTSHIQYVVTVWLLPYYIMCMCTVYQCM